MPHTKALPSITAIIDIMEKENVERPLNEAEPRSAFLTELERAVREALSDPAIEISVEQILQSIQLAIDWGFDDNPDAGDPTLLLPATLLSLRDYVASKESPQAP